MFCTFCGQEMKAGSFCPFCGHAVVASVGTGNSAAVPAGATRASNRQRRLVEVLPPILLYAVAWATIGSIANIPALDFVTRLFNMPEFYVWDFGTVLEVAGMVEDSNLLGLTVPSWIRGLQWFEGAWIASLAIFAIGCLAALITRGRWLVGVAISSFLIAADAGIFVWFVVLFAAKYGVCASPSLYLCIASGLVAFAWCVVVIGGAKDDQRA